MNRKTEVKVKFFDFLIMLQLSFTFRLPECSRPIIATFPCILFCVVVFLIIKSFLLLRAAMVLRNVSSNRCVVVCIYIFLCVEVVYGFHSVLGFFHFSLGRTARLLHCLRREQKNHDRTTKSSPFRGVKTIQGRQEHREDASVILLYRRMRICKLQHTAGA